MRPLFDHDNEITEQNCRSRPYLSEMQSAFLRSPRQFENNPPESGGGGGGGLKRGFHCYSTRR